MADANRRRGGAAAARSHQHYLGQLNATAGGSASNTPTHQRQQQQQQFAGYQQQQSPYQYQYQQQQQQQQQKVQGFNPSRSAGYRNAGRGNQPQKTNSSAKMGIKSGMTVEDLKRLTQKRIQQSVGPGTPKNVRSSGTEASFSSSAGPSSRPATPKLNMAVVNSTSSPVRPGSVATPPVIPKTGMSVQELKQLTSMRLASQSAAARPSDVTGLVSKAVLTNAAKSHYRDSLRSSLTPGNTPKRVGHHVRSSSSSQFNFSNQPQHNDLSRSHGPMGSAASDVIPVRGHRSRSRSSQMAKSAEPSALDAMPLRYSYAGGQAPEDFLSFDFGGGNSTSSQETDPGRASYDESSIAAARSALQFPEDSFPPPPPMDDSGGFVATALPSWSPPPARTKKLASVAGASSAAATPSFYSQQTSYYNIASKDEPSSGNGGASANAPQDQNAMLAPPPGLPRRPSMTVPWQVAEAVLNTPQTTSGRKKLAPSTDANDDADAVAAGLKSPAAEAAAQLSSLSMPPPRGRSGSGAPPPPPAPTTTGMTPPASSARRGSFGNAAEFFKFRRRSKSRLELARDLSYGDNGAVGDGGNGNGVFPSYGTVGSIMPGIAERHSDAQDAGRHSGASSSTSDNDESSSQEYTDEELVQVTGGYDDTDEISSSFVSFYQAARQQGTAGGAPSALSIPPPPPPGPPPMDDEDVASTSSSSKGGSGLPMMSPNGARLRKVAELARRGSLSSEDKTRAKDEIIQSSLGLGASNAARLLTTKQDERERERVPAASPSVLAPPGLSPPRATPKTAKTLTPGAGIVRSGGPITQEDLATAAQKVADCVNRGDMTAFNQAMDELAWMRSEASKTMRS